MLLSQLVILKTNQGIMFAQGQKGLASISRHFFFVFLIPFLFIFIFFRRLNSSLFIVQV
jgi:hypothetical protein